MVGVFILAGAIVVFVAIGLFYKKITNKNASDPHDISGETGGPSANDYHP